MYNKENKGTSLGSICKLSLAEELLNQSTSLKVNVKRNIRSLFKKFRNYYFIIFSDMPATQ
jgi:hypothetical protein